MFTHNPTTTHLCAFCTKFFATRDDMYRHMSRHTKEKSYDCRICNFSTASAFTLKTHLAKHGTPDSQLKCLICKTAYFPTVHHMERMHFVNKTVKWHACIICRKEFQAKIIQRSISPVPFATNRLHYMWVLNATRYFTSWKNLTFVLGAALSLPNQHILGLTELFADLDIFLAGAHAAFASDHFLR